MEVYDNKDLVIYGLLWKQNLMRLNNFIAQVFLSSPGPWFVVASATVNQVYISESMLSKGVQLLFKTATFYLIFIPGLSLLFPACHESTHLHKSFSWERREDEAEAEAEEGDS